MPATPPVTYAQLRERFADLPDTPLVLRAFNHARDRMPTYLFNQVARSWIFAVKLGRLRGINYDAEIVAASTLLHDLGLTEHASGPHRFEVNGAAAAVAFVREQGFDDRRAQLVWDSIALHATPSISFLKEPEVALCARAISVDFGAADYQAFPQADIDAIIAAVPGWISNDVSRPASATWRKPDPKSPTIISSATSARGSSRATRRRPGLIGSWADRSPSEVITGIAAPRVASGRPPPPLRIGRRLLWPWLSVRQAAR